MLLPEKQWKVKFSQLEKVDNNSWIDHYVDWLDGLITGSLVLSGIIGATSFTWNKEMFKTVIGGMAPINNKKLPAAILAGGFAAAAGMSTMVVPSGSSVGISTPATLFSAPPVTVIDSPSIMKATKNLKNNLQAAPLTSGDSMIPKYLRDAFLSLTFTVTGVNSITPSPTPLVSALTSVQ